jgi:hypothetical protein
MGINLLACFGVGKGGLDTHVTKSAIGDIHKELKGICNKAGELRGICDNPYPPLRTLEGARDTAKTALSNIKKIQGEVKKLKDVVVNENRAASRAKESQLRGMLKLADKLGKAIGDQSKFINGTVKVKQDYKEYRTRSLSSDQQREVNRRRDEIKEQNKIDRKNGDRFR